MNNDKLVGSLLIGTFVGSILSIYALVFGASLWLALSLYVVLGATTVILLAVARVYLDSVSKRGETFSATLNANKTGDRRFDDPSSQRQNTAIKNSTNLLVVDDDPFILEIVPKITAEAGSFEVSPAASGEEALRLLANPNMIFDCLLLDINMPGMDGIDLCRRVRQIPRYRYTPIIMLSAKKDMTNMGDAYRAGATDYATKPFVVDELCTRLRLAQKTIHVQRDPSHAEQEGLEHDWSRVRSLGFKTPDGQRLEVVKSLVDHVAFSNYLTQLPRTEATDIQVFALRIDNIEPNQVRSTPQEFVSLLQDVAETVADCLGVAQTLMAYVDNATLLIALNSKSLLPPIIVEKNIEKRLQNSASDYGIRLELSVGGPIKLQDKKADRAIVATDHAIGLAKSRSEYKYGTPVAGLFKG